MDHCVDIQHLLDGVGHHLDRVWHLLDVQQDRARDEASSYGGGITVRARRVVGAWRRVGVALDAARQEPVAAFHAPRRCSARSADHGVGYILDSLAQVAPEVAFVDGGWAAPSAVAE
jgi:hypothetical protein